MIVNIDGAFLEPEEARLRVDDGGFLFGDTLFETLKAHGKKLLFAKEHLDRLELSARLVDFPCDRKGIETALKRTARRLTSPVSRVRLTLTRGSFEGLTFPQPQTARFIIMATPAQEPTDEERQTGISCVIAPNRRVNPLNHLPQMKRGNYADCLYARNHAQSKGAGEALFVTEQGELLEGATSNIFLARDGDLVTPPAGELVLAGILRRKVLVAAQTLGLSAVERTVQAGELETADEVFLTNSLIDLLPVARIEGREIPRGSLWSKLLAEVRGRAEKEQE